jgi:outer membrane lipoprotein SlyB
MEAQASKPANPILVAAAIALILFCAAGIAAIMGWIPTSLGKGATAQTAQTADAPAKATAQTADAPAKATAHASVPEKRHALTAKTEPAPTQVASTATCAECGVIESVREVDAKGKGTGLGGVGGAVVGGLLGNQVGAGRGRSAMTVIGAVGGAVAGNEIEKRVKSTKSYEVTVRFDDGSSRVFSESSPPAWRTGDRVRIVDGQIRSNNA